MKKVIIIDDEPLARSVVESYLKAFPELEIVAQCPNGFEGLKAIEEHHPELVFLDIQMPKINGFEMLELIDEPPAVIFTTAFDEYAIKAFETSAVDYLLKPFAKDRFEKAINKWMDSNVPSTPEQFQNLAQSRSDEHLRIVVKDGGEIKIIPTVDVIFIEAYDDYVKIHTKDGYHLKKKTMGHYEKALPAEKFMRIHRSYIINIDALSKIESFEKNSYRATLLDGNIVPISRTAYPLLKSTLGL
ncbi:MAG: DNA-binding response regulator [Fluviicola sp. XM-24bin1]|nr:MAG: DNA-binding response regulator [Fluviicola sp. XM-24bin1]